MRRAGVHILRDRTVEAVGRPVGRVDLGVEAEERPSPKREDFPVTERIRIEQHSVAGTLWFAAWLFTIGFLDLTFWRGVLAILLWPYYLGVTFGPLLPVG